MGQPREISDNPYEQLRADAARIRGLRGELADAIATRDRTIVDAVDDGFPQDKIAAAAGITPQRVIAILAGSVDAAA